MASFPARTFKHRCRIFHRLRERSHAVQRRGESDQTVAADPTIGRKHPNHATECSRLPYGSSGIGSKRRHGKTRRHRSGRATARSSRNPIESPGVANRSVSRVFVRTPHCEFVAVQFAQQDSPGGLEPLNRRSVIRRPVALQNQGTRRSRGPPHHQNVLDAHRNPGQWGQNIAALRHRIDLRGLRQGPFPAQGKIAVNLPVFGCNPVIVRLGQRRGGGASGCNRVPHLIDCQTLQTLCCQTHLSTKPANRPPTAQ